MKLSFLPHAKTGSDVHCTEASEADVSEQAFLAILKATTIVEHYESNIHDCFLGVSSCMTYNFFPIVKLSF